MSSHVLRKALLAYLLLLTPLACLAARFDPYALDGDAVSYMDLADLIHAHRWADVINGYWNPLYPAVLCLGQILFHPTRINELRAYYAMNLLLFGLQVVAMLVFVRALGRWRARLQLIANPLFSTPALQLVGLALQTAFLMRELSIGKIRTDSLLEALLLLSLAMLMEALAAATASSSLWFAALMGLFFGLAYLTKSVAFILALVATAGLIFFLWSLGRKIQQALLCGAVSLTVFVFVAGPYIGALSHQQHRFDIGDSGPLNYAWAVSGTEHVHLEPGTPGRYGSASVRLVHPETQLIINPGVYSYRSHPDGTYPPWFAPAYFNERIRPVFAVRRQLRTMRRNILLVVRYLVDHSEPLILLAVLLAFGARLRGVFRIAGPPFCVALVIWTLYLAVVVEGRYVSVAYAAVLLPLFASLEDPSADLSTGGLRRVASAVLILYACVALADLLQNVAAERRDEIVHQALPAWRDHQIYGAGEALRQLGILPGDAIACVGSRACVYDQYWARVSGARILAEIDLPDQDHLVEQLDRMSNFDEVLQTLHRQGARVLVGNFDPGAMNNSHPAAKGWTRLGETNFYALPLNLTSAVGAIH